MKRFTFAVITALISLPLYAGQSLVLEPTSTLSLSGDSTLHPFTSTATVLKLTAERQVGEAGDAWKPVLESGALNQLVLVIPVQGLKSKDSGLDKNLYKALKTDLHPDIIFELSRYETRPSTRSLSEFQVKAEGFLQVAGQKRPIVLEIEVTPDIPALRAQGVYALRMTDYGIKPPKLMLGAIKVKNEVVIHFDLRLR